MTESGVIDQLVLSLKDCTDNKRRDKILAGLAKLAAAGDSYARSILDETKAKAAPAPKPESSAVMESPVRKADTSSERDGSGSVPKAPAEPVPILSLGRYWYLDDWSQREMDEAFRRALKVSDKASEQCLLNMSTVPGSEGAYAVWLYRLLYWLRKYREESKNLEHILRDAVSNGAGYAPDRNILYRPPRPLVL